MTRLVEYARRLGVSAVIGRLGFLLELNEMVTTQAVEALQRRLGSAYVLLDPVLPREGKYVRRWRLRLTERTPLSR